MDDGIVLNLAEASTKATRKASITKSGRWTDRCALDHQASHTHLKTLRTE